MRSNRTTRKAGNTTTENDPPPARLLHCRHTKLRQQIRAPTIGAPRLLEILNTDLPDLLDAGFPQTRAGIVEQNSRMAHTLDNLFVKAAHFVVVAEIGLKGPRFDALDGRFELCYKRFGGGGGGVVVDGDGAAEGGEGNGGGFADAWVENG